MNELRENKQSFPKLVLVNCEENSLGCCCACESEKLFDYEMMEHDQYHLQESCSYCSTCVKTPKEKLFNAQHVDYVMAFLFSIFSLAVTLYLHFGAISCQRAFFIMDFSLYLRFLFLANLNLLCNIQLDYYLLQTLLLLLLLSLRS